MDLGSTTINSKIDWESYYIKSVNRLGMLVTPISYAQSVQ